MGEHKTDQRCKMKAYDRHSQASGFECVLRLLMKTMMASHIEIDTCGLHVFMTTVRLF